MAVNLSPVGGVAAQFFTNTGAVLTGGKIYTYAAGTTTPAVTYTSSSGATAWSNPIVLDAAGRVSGSGEIWLTDGVIYKFVLKDTNDVLIATYDNITGINSNSVAYTNQQEIITATSGQTVFDLSIDYQPGTNSLSVFVDGVNQYGPGAMYAYTETDSNTVTFNSGLHVGAEVKFTTTQQQGAGAVDASQVTYDPPFTGSVATNVEAKLAQTVSVMDFGAVGDGVTDDTVAIQAAIDYGVQNGVDIYFPGAIYRTTSELFIDRSFNNLDPTQGGRYGITLRGDGAAASLISSDHAGNCIRFLGGPGAGWHTQFVIQGLCLTQPDNAQLVGSKGLYLDQAAYVQMRDFDLSWFEYGLYCVDVLSSNFSDGTIRFNEYGFKFQKGTRSHPNNISFSGISVINNQTYGGSLIKPSEFNFFGGSIESNGYTGILADPNSWGLYVESAGTEGSVGINMQGVYIENNNGKADIWILQTTNNVIHNFNGCSFLRFLDTRYVTNCILFNSTNDSRLSINGCGFKDYTPYVSDASRLWIAAGDAQVFDGGGNLFFDTTGGFVGLARAVFAPIASNHQLPFASLPSVSEFRNGIIYCPDGGGGSSRPALAVSDGAKWWQIVLGQFAGNVAAAGTAQTLPRGWTSSKSGTGVYVITHNLNLAADSYALVATPRGGPGVGYCSGWVLGSNTATIYFSNPAGAATDMDFSFMLNII